MAKKRCGWCLSDTEFYIPYHDEEWGVPCHDDCKLFEMLILEGAQAGLSWITILKKREAYREAYDNFEVQKVAKYSTQKLEELRNNAGIIRNKLKIKASVTNAQIFIKIQEEFGSFNHYIWAFVNNSPIQNVYKTLDEVPASTPLSDVISKDLKKRGMKFIGSTIIYAYLQAIGMVNDHLTDCFRNKEVREITTK